MSEHWRTIEVLWIQGTAYAYQQRIEVVERKDKDRDYKRDRATISEGLGIGLGLGVGVGAATIPREKHRLVPISETLDESELTQLVEDVEV